MIELCTQLIVLTACLTGFIDPNDPATEQRLLSAAVAHAEEVAREAEPELPTRSREASAPTTLEPPPTSVGWPWGPLADCESGEWDADAQPIPGSRRWDYGAPGAFTRPGYPFHGGLNFHPDTWSWVAPMVGLGHIRYAYQATPQEQVRVGEKVRQLQGWKAWPVCSRKVGLR